MNICIISQQHLSRNPRVLKESVALCNVGFHVTILTSVYSKDLLSEDIKLLRNKDIGYIFYNNLSSKTFISYLNRLVSKLGRWINRIGFQNKWALGYAPNRCLSMALKQSADLYICHQELPTYIGTILSQRGNKVVFDIEDWYTNDLLPNARKYRGQKLLQKAEKQALTLGKLIYTTSIPMAKTLAKKYNIEPPHVIYNSFIGFNHSIITNGGQHIKLIWISQTIGPGRGLEGIIRALNSIDYPKFELNLRGSIDAEYQSFLLVSLTNKIHVVNFLDLIPNNEIQQDLISYDIGLAIEPSYPLNKDLTISNKIFHYLSVGLPVLASATQGQLSLKDDFKGFISYFKSDIDLKQILTSVSRSTVEERIKILSIYKEKYDWHIVEKKLQNLINSIN